VVFKLQVLFLLTINLEKSDLGTFEGDKFT